jgi:general L-amino acid transport system substrate-binding protein
MKFMRKSALILAIAPLVFAIAACSGDSPTASTPGTPGSNPAAPATRNRWDSIKSRGQMVSIAALMSMSVVRSQQLYLTTQMQ